MTWMPGGHNDWLSMSNSTAQFELKFNRKAEHCDTFDVEAGRAAKLIQQTWGNKPLYLALSGGIDSEFVAQTLLNNRIPFTPVILKIGDLNILETWYAEYWCYLHNIKPVVIAYTLEQYSAELVKFFPKLHKLKNYIQAPILIMYDYVHRAGGHCIYAGGDINLDPQRKEFYCDSLDFISNIVDVGYHPTSFFMYTPELALAYVKPFDINLTEQYNKIALYNISPRPKIDYVTVLHRHPELRSVIDKLYYTFKIDQNPHETTFWYGTKQQLMQNLQP